MKVVYNPKGFGLNLTHAEMELICERKGEGWHVVGYDVHGRDVRGKGSTQAWFCVGDSKHRIDWMDFRSDPLLVSMVESGELSNKDLVVCEAGDDYYIDTDWSTWESIKKRGVSMKVTVVFEFEGVDPNSPEADEIVAEITESCETMRIAFDANACWVDNACGDDAASYT
jgi:hypothetical protein